MDGNDCHATVEQLIELFAGNAGRIASDLSLSRSDLWVSHYDVLQIYVAATGMMRFPDQETAHPRVPVGLTIGGQDRHQVWRAALHAIAGLEPEEVKLRTSRVEKEVHADIDAFFANSDHLSW